MLLAALLAVQALSMGETDTSWMLDVLQEKEDPKALERKIEELEKKRKELDRKVEEALEKRQGDEAVRLAEERKKVDEELAQARKTLAELRKPKPGLAFGGELLLTHWDNDLDLADRVGWSASLTFIPALGFEYSRWETEDEDGDDDALVQVYRLGLHATGNLLTDLTFGIVSMVGLVRFTSDAPGTDGDTGPIFSLHPGATWKMSEHLSFSAGVLIDILRTDFNQARTHTNHNFSLTAGLHLRF